MTSLRLRDRAPASGLASLCLLVVACATERAPATPLFVEARATSPFGNGRVLWPNEQNGNVFVINGNGAGSLANGTASFTVSHPVAAFSGANGEVIAAEADGRVIVFHPASGELVREFVAPGVVLAGRRGRLAAVRTVREFHLAPIQPDDPLIWVLSESGETLGTLGEARASDNVMLGQLANAGWAVFAPDGGVYFAFALRPELHRYDEDGGLRWVIRWTPERAGPEPRLSAHQGQVSPEFAEIQHAIALGPDGHIYVVASSSVRARPTCCWRSMPTVTN